MKTLKLYVLIFFVFSLTLILCKHNSSDLREGDLLFKQEIDDDFTHAIASATNSLYSFKFTHVGVVHYENNQCYVIEAILKGVCMTPINDFVNDSSIVIQARLKEEYQSLIPVALDSIKSQLGKKYDPYFSANNDAYYCSELIQQFYIQNDTPIFPPIKMSFKNIETGEFPEYWINHFADLGVEIPENEWGSNPGQLSKSDKLIVIGELTDF